MIKEYRYILEKGSRKHLCPSTDCGKKTFVRYIDTITGNLMPSRYGRCDREIKCGYNLNPYQERYISNDVEDNFKLEPDLSKKRVFNRNHDIAFVPQEVLKQTLDIEGYKQNRFIQNLLSQIPFPFDTEVITKVIAQYYIGTVSHGFRSGATTFPYIDIHGNVRTIQVKQFDHKNHTISTNFIHSMIEQYHKRTNTATPEWLTAYQRNELKVSCLFGEHLLNKYYMNPVALVEAPKTAIYSTLYFGFPENPKNLIWLAVYNLSSLNYQKCKELKGRDVYLFPDLSEGGRAFDLWRKRAKELNSQMPETRFVVSDLLETKAIDSDREKGSDIADILIKTDWRAFRHIEEIQPVNGGSCLPNLESEISEISVASKRTYLSYEQQVSLFYTKKVEILNNWDYYIKDLELYFATAVLPLLQLQLTVCSTVTDIDKFIDSHFSIIKAHNGKRTFLPYLDRLKELKRYMILNTNQTKKLI